jgi:hypothetical protein
LGKAEHLRGANAAERQSFSEEYARAAKAKAKAEALPFLYALIIFCHFRLDGSRRLGTVRTDGAGGRSGDNARCFATDDGATTDRDED